ncbi:MAG: hypothetical protein ACKVS9_16835, partial [Phycisphaerae bacterium]
ILPAVTIVDFGGNIITNSDRTITLNLQTNPGSATLAGINAKVSSSGVARWEAGDNLNIVTAATGYTLRALQNGAALLTSDTADSEPFDILAGPPDSMQITLQPASTTAGGDILINVSVFDAASNLVTTPSVDITLDPAVNPGGWPLLVASSLTKPTVGGVASWAAADDLRINKAVVGYRLAASGVGQTIFTNLFDITPATPALLAFVQQPSNATEDVAINSAITVEVTDAFANRTDSAVAIQLAVAADGCSGVVGNGTATSAAGLATFAGVTIDTPCAAATLAASSSGLVGALSDTFVIAAAAVVDDDDDADDGGNENVNVNAGDDGGADDDANVPADDIANGNACAACGLGAASAMIPMLLALTAMRWVTGSTKRQRSANM